jgi:hypothetical protein
VLYGQSIIKLIAGTLGGRMEKWEVVAFLAALTIVIGLVPSLTVLSLILTSNEQSTGLVVGQICLFLVGICVFLFFGVIGHYGLFHIRQLTKKTTTC